MRDAEALSHVRAAFGTIARPAQFTNRSHCCECAEHDDLLASRDLDSLALEDVGNAGWDPICFATDEAFMYFFPALARLALDEPGHQGWYFEQLLFHLTYEDAANRRLRAATPVQRRAVLSLLRHVGATRSARLREYRCEERLDQALRVWSLPGQV